MKISNLTHCHLEVLYQGINVEIPGGSIKCLRHLVILLPLLPPLTLDSNLVEVLQKFAKRHDLHWQFSDLLQLYKVLFAQPQFPTAKSHYLFSVAACNVCLYNVIDDPLKRSFMLLVQEELKWGSKHTNMVLNKLATIDYNQSSI
ncbi:hypothetical protein Pcinc_024222 [Petrolisthes cinctipes]|uniref:Uncharacterized protein n=1 Tax=Petrolisthes cinctipes TaxID=88211 RepID=A0AAE1FAU2_PETCI|nr:hypothetical protein Pcinc_024222 [Petrolisthes cinctipes]